jgi:hypothetical protein
MSQEHTTPAQDNPKSSTRRASDAAGDLSCLVIATACEVLGGLSHASAEAFKTVDSHVSAQKPNLIEGVLKGNARFLEEMSHTMETVAERFRLKYPAGADQSAEGPPAAATPKYPST